MADGVVAKGRSVLAKVHLTAVIVLGIAGLVLVLPPVQGLLSPRKTVPIITTIGAMVRAPDGTLGTVPSEQLEQAQSVGYVATTVPIEQAALDAVTDEDHRTIRTVGGLLLAACGATWLLGVWVRWLFK